MTSNLPEAINETLDEVTHSRDFWVRHGQALETRLSAAIRRDQKLHERITAMLDDEDGPDDYGRGRREGWNVALTAVLNILSEEAT